ncbi:MAG: hypothetical protein ACFB9M_12775 [Myxococcota bacterium]
MIVHVAVEGLDAQERFEVVADALLITRGALSGSVRPSHRALGPLRLGAHGRIR